MRYFIQYPCYLVCNLRCPYCFHHKELTTGLSSGDDPVGQGGPNFTIDEYVAWRDTHLQDAEEILIHFHGGEPTMPVNISLIKQFMSKSNVEKLDVLSNGLGLKSSYEELINLKDRIYRIGFTYHRKVIKDDPTLKQKFISNVMMLKKAGMPIYVKEMLFLDARSEIIAHSNFWKMMGVSFKIQDFKGYSYGEDFEEVKKYTTKDIALIDSEYIKTGRTCNCLKGYKQILIRGGWQAGDILACWIDPTVVGNIQENTFNPNYSVELGNSPESPMIVTGVPKNYKGTYDKDRRQNSLKK